MAEPDNRFDKKAVMALDSRGRKLGYIPRHENAIIGALLKAGKIIYGIMPDEQPVQGAVAPGSEKTPFSNHVIDTLQMAANRLPWIRNASLDNLAEELGIEVHCDTREESRCRMTWKLYCRMERSELGKN